MSSLTCDGFFFFNCPDNKLFLFFPSLGLISKAASKYSHEKEAEAQHWLEALTGEKVGSDFVEGLKNGVILCK